MYGLNITFENSERANLAVETVNKILDRKGFVPIAANLYVCQENGLLNTFKVLQLLKTEKVVKDSITNICAFRISDLSNLTNLLKE
jgi:Uncharacterized virulence-associated protein D